MACHLREKYDYTPSDFDLSFNYNQIPCNIQLSEDNTELEKRLQKLMPLSKKIHLDLLDVNHHSEDNCMYINSELNLTIANKAISVVFK